MRVPLHRARFDLPSVGQARDALFNLFFPPRCVVCGQWGVHLCDACLAGFPRVAPSASWRTDGLSQPSVFRSRRAAFIYVGDVREAILALKYEGRTAVAGPLVAAADVSAIPDDVDQLVAVPMHKRRRRLRGFNQTDLIARHLAARLDRPVATDALRRTRATAPQARQPDWEARRRNVAGAFAASPRHAGGRRFLLIDDVTTSGATFDFCARALLDAGAESVDAWAVARGGEFAS